MQVFAALDHGIEPKLRDDRVIAVFANRVDQTLREFYWPGRCSADGSSHHSYKHPPHRGKILISRLFPMTPSMRSLKGSASQAQLRCGQGIPGVHSQGQLNV